MSKETGKWRLEPRHNNFCILRGPDGRSYGDIDPVDGLPAPAVVEMVALANAALAIKADAPFALPLSLEDCKLIDAQGGYLADFVHANVGDGEFIVNCINSASTVQAVVAERDALKAECERLRAKTFDLDIFLRELGKRIAAEAKMPTHEMVDEQKRLGTHRDLTAVRAYTITEMLLREMMAGGTSAALDALS